MILLKLFSSEAGHTQSPFILQEVVLESVQELMKNSLGRVALLLIVIIIIDGHLCNTFVSCFD